MNRFLNLNLFSKAGGGSGPGGSLLNVFCLCFLQVLTLMSTQEGGGGVEALRIQAVTFPGTYTV